MLAVASLRTGRRRALDTLSALVSARGRRSAIRIVPKAAHVDDLIRRQRRELRQRRSGGSGAMMGAGRFSATW